MGQHLIESSHFFAVLKQHGFQFELMDDGRTKFTREGTPPERHIIESQVARGIVMRFAHKYKIPRAEFWPSTLRGVEHNDGE